MSDPSASFVDAFSINWPRCILQTWSGNWIVHEIWYEYGHEYGHDETSVLRGATTTKLFISYVKPYKAVGTHANERWVTQLRQYTGIDTTIFEVPSCSSMSVSYIVCQQIL